MSGKVENEPLPSANDDQSTIHKNVFIQNFQHANINAGNFHTGHGSNNPGKLVWTYFDKVLNCLIHDAFCVTTA